MADSKINIFDALKRADKHDFNWYNNLTDEEKKDFQPWVFQRWVSSKKLELVNEITNPLIGSVPKDISWRLFCSIGIPSIGRYSFIAPPKKVTSKKGDKLVGIVAKYYDVSMKVAATYMPLVNEDDIMGMAKSLGYDDKELKEVKKLFGKS